jgi:nitrogen-specific signal transduction histidine kinase
MTFRYPSGQTQNQGILSDLDQVVDKAIRQSEQGLSERVEIERNLEPTPPVRAHVAQITQIVFNLVLNANHALDPSRTSGQVTTRPYMSTSPSIGVAAGGKSVSRKSISMVRDRASIGISLIKPSNGFSE